jgi:hypothetical protein
MYMKSWVQIRPHNVSDIVPSTCPSSAQNIGPSFQNGEFCMHYYRTSSKIFPKFVRTCIRPHTQLSGVLICDGGKFFCKPYGAVHLVTATYG